MRRTSGELVRKLAYFQRIRFASELVDESQPQVSNKALPSGNSTGIELAYEVPSEGQKEEVINSDLIIILINNLIRLPRKRNLALVWLRSWLN